MSDSNSDQQEPSMEEILASIRRIISEDGDEITDGEDRPKPVAAEPTSAGADDAPAAVSEPVVGDLDDDILELTDVVEEDVASEPEPEPEPLPEPEPPVESVVEDRKLVSDEVEQVSAATISGLTAALAASARVGDGNKTLEQLVKELLRPILKDWLDTNLPGMVERIVREEVERIADRAKK